jgi:hypothetical protein
LDEIYLSQFSVSILGGALIGCNLSLSILGEVAQAFNPLGVNLYLPPY